MIDCDVLIEELHQLAREQIELAIIAAAPPVCAMHIDLALFGIEQAQFAGRVCADG